MKKIYILVNFLTSYQNFNERGYTENGPLRAEIDFSIRYQCKFFILFINQLVFIFILSNLKNVSSYKISVKIPSQNKLLQNPSLNRCHLIWIQFNESEQLRGASKEDLILGSLAFRMSVQMRISFIQ